MSLLIILQVLTVVGLAVLGILGKYYLPSYTKKKGENLATREDIEEITTKMESVKNLYAEKLEELKSTLNRKHHAHSIKFSHEFKILEELWQLLIKLRELVALLPSQSREAREARSELKAATSKVELFAENRYPFISQNVWTALGVISNSIRHVYFSEELEHDVFVSERQEIFTKIVGIGDMIRDIIQPT